MSTIFLSYARQDAKLVRALADDLRALDNAVWLDENVSGGQTWWNHILDQIRTCDVFVFALSPDALDSLACRRESEYADALGKPILPILLTGDAPRLLPPVLAAIQYVDFRDQTREALLRLARALNSLPATPPLPDPLPTPPEAPISYINQLAAEVTAGAPLHADRQSTLVLELKQSLNDSGTADDARALLKQLRSRRDLLARTAGEIDEVLGTTPAVAEVERPGRSRTILWSIVITTLCLGLVAFLLGESWVDVRLEQRQPALVSQLAEAEQRVQSIEAAQRQAEQALENEKATHQKVREERDDLQNQVSELQARSGQLEQQLTQAEQGRKKLRQRDAERQEEIARLKQEKQILVSQVGEAEQRVQATEAVRRQLAQALENEKKLVAELQAEKSKRNPTNPSKTYKNSIKMEFVLIPAGTFDMGSNDGADDEKPVHPVTISRPFYLGKYEVTQAQWKAVMKSNPNERKGDDLPVTNVSWNDVQEFIKKLNAKEGGNAYRLPTEAEWEYAARAGTTTAYSFGGDPELLAQYDWYNSNSGGKTQVVGQLKRNPWGLYDMHGNVWEWVQDWYAETYPAGPQTDPRGPDRGHLRVVRGGSVASSPAFLYSARRVGDGPKVRSAYLGFQCVRVPQP